MKKISCFLIIIMAIFSCDKEISIRFTENTIETSERAVISINYPKAEGTPDVADRINKAIENYIVNQTNMSEDSLVDMSIDEAVKKFNTEYTSFKNQFQESEQKWEVLIDGEITYQSPEIISIAINSYTNTGGAHGNTYVQFLNFDPQTGALFEKNALLSNTNEFTKLVERFFKNEVKTDSDGQSAEDFFFGKDFQLPSSIGFSDEGVIILYNTYEIASYAQGITEFTIPFDEASAYLKVH